MPEPDDLIAELRELGARWPVPPAVDQRAAVRARLTSAAPRRSRARLWLAALAAALIAAVAGVAPARAAVVEVVGDLLRVAGIEVRREHPPVTLPATPAPLPSASPAVLDEARRLAAFPVLVPTGLGAPESVRLADPDPRGHPRVITMAFRGGTVRFDQFYGRLDPVFLKTTPNVEPVELGGPDTVAAWLPDEHPVTYVGRDGVPRTGTARLAGPALIWSTGAVTYRLEGIVTLEEAIAVARSVR